MYIGRHRINAYDSQRSAYDGRLQRKVFCRPTLCIGRANPSSLIKWHSFLPKSRSSVDNATEPKHMGAQLLTTEAALEHGYQVFLGSGNLQVFQLQVKELDKLHQQWISDLAIFKHSVRAGGAEPKALEYVEEAFGRLAERIEKLAD